MATSKAPLRSAPSAGRMAFLTGGGRPGCFSLPLAATGTLSITRGQGRDARQGANHAQSAVFDDNGRSYPSTPSIVRRFRVGAVAGLGLATTVALLPSGPAFGAGVHYRRPDPPLQVAHVVSLASGGKPVLSNQPADYIPATIGGKTVVIDPRSSVGHTDPSCEIPPGG